MGAEKKNLYITVVLLLLPVVIIIAVATGPVRLPWPQTAAIIWTALTGGDLSRFGANSLIVFDLRLPRVLLSAAVGAALSVSGAAFQALFRNPLADPYVVGVSAGAALGATVAIGFGLAFAGSQVLATSILAFVGALGVSYLVYRISRGAGALSSLVLLLAGMAVSAFLSALISLIMVLESRNLSETVFWLMGGFTGRGWRELFLALPLIFAGTAGLWFLHKELNLLLLPEDEARSLGLNVARMKAVVLGLGSLLAAAAVAVSGLIGFVGLIVPHLVRLITGPDHRYLLVGSFLTGAVLLVPADLIARTWLAPLELPVGAITSLFGGPFFLYLLLKAKKEGRGF